jgi:hypothetical protein
MTLNLVSPYELIDAPILLKLILQQNYGMRIIHRTPKDSLGKRKNTWITHISGGDKKFKSITTSTRNQISFVHNNFSDKKKNSKTRFITAMKKRNRGSDTNC